MDAALPLWADAGFDRRTGLFHEKLDHAGEPVAAPLRARVQARQTYVFIKAGALGWGGDWRTLAEAGLKALCGPLRASSGAAGNVLDERGVLIDPRWDLYNQAFSLFALAHARALDPRAADARVAELLAFLNAHRGRNGGFIEGELKPSPRWQNPHMHLFEAGIALKEAGLPGGEPLAREIARLFDAYFYDAAHGALREYFTDDLTAPAPGEEGRYSEPGHHCEWIWLLDRWRRHGGGDRALQGAKLWARVERDGLLNGVAIDGIWSDDGPRATTARLWPQTERLKAALVRYEIGRGAEADVCAAYDGLALFFAGLQEGLWWDTRLPDGTFVDEPAPASSFYHITLALSELFRIAKL